MKLVVLASGNGSNAQALMDAARDRTLSASVEAVVTDRPTAGVIDRADDRGVRTVVVEPLPTERRAAYDLRLAEKVASFEPDLVVLAGWMRILTANFLDRFPTINLHPALPGQLPGTNAIGRAFAQFEAGERTETGVMVHWVPDEGVDDGPVIATETVPMKAGDTEDDLTQRVHLVEHRVLVRAVGALATELSLEPQ